MMNPAVATGLAAPEQQKAFDETNAAFYAMVDWALDLREAQFVECDIRRIPANPILRDPETQVVVRQETALRGEWKNVDLSGTYWAAALEFFLERGDPDVVLVAPKRSPRFRQLLDGPWKLRVAGITEPD